MNKRALGAGYESMACEYIEKSNGIIKERNFRCRQGEIDIIAREDKYLCFVEVKYRTGEKYGDAASAVNYAKQKKICDAARFYLYMHKYPDDTPVRYDVLTVTSGEGGIAEFNWIKNAFDHI